MELPHIFQKNLCGDQSLSIQPQRKGSNVPCLGDVSLMVPLPPCRMQTDMELFYFTDFQAGKKWSIQTNIPQRVNAIKRYGEKREKNVFGAILQLCFPTQFIRINGKKTDSVLSGFCSRDDLPNHLQTAILRGFQIISYSSFPGFRSQSAAQTYLRHYSNWE